MNRPSIHPYANLESLFEGLLAAFQKVQGTCDPALALKPVPVIVPSIQFTDWLQVAIAKRKGLCMGLDFMMPQEFIERVLERADSKDEDRDNPWSKSNLTWRLLPHIKDYTGQMGVKIPSARKDTLPPEPSPRDCFALAALLADQFDQYGHFRPRIIEIWDRGKTTAKSHWTKADKENEAWQRELWRKVQSDINESGNSRPHPALVLNELAGNDAFLKSLNALFPRLFVVGTGALDPLLVRVLQLLGNANCKVQAHLALPSLGYLGEMRNAARTVEQDPEALQMPRGHPLLVSMGRHAVGSFLLLGEMDENYTHWPDSVSFADQVSHSSSPARSQTGLSTLHDSPFTIHPSSTLLNRLQADIRQLRMPEGDYIQSNDDLSLRVHSCYGPRREMEVLRDELLRAFSDLEGLKPEEVMVVTPSLETYAPLVSAVLEQSPALPVRLTELPQSERNPNVEGLLSLLEMSWGKFEASTLLELLHLRAVRACLGIPDDSAGPERLRDWIDQSGLTRGLDGEDDLSAIATGSWRFARDRMIAGKWFGAEADARYPGEDYVLPVADDLGGDTELKQAFIEWHWQLSQTLREWRNDSTPSVWSVRLGLACDQLLSSQGDDDARLETQQTLNFLARIECNEPVDAATIFDWLQSECAESGRRTPISGRITFGRLKQLQNMPCRVLAMVGMQDRAFPRQNRIPAWDLLHLDPRAWDRNARIDDRQLFLDALLSPADRLIITASTLNVRSGKFESFSSCVDELLRAARATVKNKIDLICKHRLQPFAPDYFRPNADEVPLPLSFDSNSAKVAESFLQGNTHAPIATPFWNQEAPSGFPVSSLPITIEQLAAFWKDPAKAFLRTQGIVPAFDEADDESLDRAPLGIEGLDKWNVKSDIVHDIIEARHLIDYTKALLFADRQLPPSELGNLAWDSLHGTAEQLERKIRELKTGSFSVDLNLHHTTPDVRITGTVLLGKSDEGEGVVAWRVGKFTEARDYLQPWIQAIVAACAGHSMRSFIVDEENLESFKSLEKYDPERAGELLDHLIDGFLQGRSRPLCYAPVTSNVYAKACKQWEYLPDENALKKASDKWNEEPYNGPRGEGFLKAAKIAWRDQDPFVHQAAWHHWARHIAKPLNDWFAPEKKSSRKLPAKNAKGR